MTARTLFKGSNLLDGRGASRAATTVIVEGERIVGVMEDAAAPAAGPDDRVIDLAGRTLMPGMVQGHFHSHFGAFGEGVTAPALGLEASPGYLAMLAARNARTALDCGFTGAIGSSNAWTIDVALKEAILQGVVTGPRYLAGTRELVTTGESSDYDNNRNWYMGLGHTGLTYKVDGAEAYRLAARVEIGRGGDVLKISTSPGHGSVPARDILYQTREELRAAVETTHKLGKKVRAHSASRASTLECARAGVDLIDHADRMDAECIEAILEAGCFVLPSMLWSVRFLEVAENWDHAAHPLPINEGFPESLDATLARIRGVREDFDYTCRIVPEAHAAGVKMVVGDDFGTPIMEHGDYISELEFYVKQLGIPALDVIGWATRNGYDAMGLGDEAGTVEEGKLADLLVVDGDPSGDVTCLRDTNNLLAILKGGVFVKDALEL
jgi:imidazolonepropionase-like amidohydrolase